MAPDFGMHHIGNVLLTRMLGAQKRTEHSNIPISPLRAHDNVLISVIPRKKQNRVAREKESTVTFWTQLQLESKYIVAEENKFVDFFVY